MQTFLLSLGPLLELAIAVVLIRAYIRTRDVGFVWLGIAVLVWPIISRLLQHGEQNLIYGVRNHPVGWFPFTLVERGQMTRGYLLFLLGVPHQIIGAALMLVAVRYLGRTRGCAGNVPATPQASA
jgi:hypothetical protein